MKDYDKNKESYYLKYWDINSLYRCAMSPKSFLGSLNWLKKHPNLIMFSQKPVMKVAI